MPLVRKLSRSSCPSLRISSPLVLLALAGLLMAGCGELEGRPQTPAETPEAAVAEPDPAAVETPRSVPEVKLTQASWEEIERAAKSAGRPTVLDVWSLSCEPCLKEFPGLVQLDQQRGERVQCISANIDFDGRRTRPPETYAAKALEFLTKQRAELTNYLCTTASDEVYEALDIPSIPAVLVFDAEGQEVARFVDAGETVGFTYKEDVIPFVEKMLSDTPPPDAE